MKEGEEGECGREKGREGFRDIIVAKTKLAGRKSHTR